MIVKDIKDKSYTLTYMKHSTKLLILGRIKYL